MFLMFFIKNTVFYAVDPIAEFGYNIFNKILTKSSFVPLYK